MSEGKLAVARLPPLTGPNAPDRNKIESFSGQPYRLHGNVYPLPPPRALRPYVDTKAGEIDTWPAHASGLALTSSAAMLSKTKSLVQVSEDEGGKAPIIPKPRFLEQLENFLHKELRALGVSEVTPSDLRLQAHREVFEYLIEDFKTYKPLLAAIKNEYEMMLAFQRQQIRQLEPLKQMLVTVSEQCDQKIMGLRDEERQEIAGLKAENRNLYARITSLVNDQKDLEEQVNRLQETLQEEHQKFRDECDARKLLIADINDLRYQQEDYLASKQASSDQADSEDDPTMLKIALKQAREDEKKASVRLNEMIANYGDVIPRRDYEALEKKHKELEEQSETTQTDFRKLQAEHNALLDVQKQVTAQRDQFYLELENLKRSSTPRPDWDKCADYVRGGMVRWKELAEDKSSNELMDLLLNEIGTGGFVDSAGAEYFDGQGTGPSVPRYLSFEGPVRNRRLGKRDTLLLIRDIWREKSASDAERRDGTRDKMADFLYTYLQQRFSLEQMVVEWGYNLHDACQRYSHDDAIRLFWKVLNEEADEEVFHQQLQQMHSLLTELTKADMQEGNVGRLPRLLFQSTLQEALPGVDEDTMAAIMNAADTELEDESPDIDYKSLFTEDDEGKTGPFLEEVKKWHQQLKEQYMEEIQEQLENVNPVGVDDLKRALTLADPEMDSTVMEAYVTWGFGVTSGAALAEVSPMEQSLLLERLRNGNVHRVGRKL